MHLLPNSTTIKLYTHITIKLYTSVHLNTNSKLLSRVSRRESPLFPTPNDEACSIAGQTDTNVGGVQTSIFLVLDIVALISALTREIFITIGLPPIKGRVCK